MLRVDACATQLRFAHLFNGLEDVLPVEVDL
jgi:hypothetical protein